MLLVSFYKSWLVVWDEGIYFDNEGPIEYRFLHPDREAIAEIASYDFFTLFEASILIGERTGSVFIGSQVEIYVDAIVNRRFMPRHPSLYLKWNDIPSAKQDGIPDLNWVLSRQELYEFASTRWPPSLFADLRDNEPEAANGAKASTLRTSALVIENAYVHLIQKHNRRPTPDEIWEYLKSQAGIDGSKVAEFLEDAETDDGKGKISLINADGRIGEPIGFKTIRNNTSRINKKGNFN